MIQLYGKLFVSHYTQLGLIAGDVRRTKENRGGDQKSRPRHNYAQASSSSNSNSNLNVDNTQTSKRPITSYYTPTTSSSSSSTTSTSTERSYYNNNNNGNYNSNYNNNDDSKRKPQNNGIFKFITQINHAYCRLSASFPSTSPFLPSARLHRRQR